MNTTTAKYTEDEIKDYLFLSTYAILLEHDETVRPKVLDILEKYEQSNRELYHRMDKLMIWGDSNKVLHIELKNSEKEKRKLQNTILYMLITLCVESIGVILCSIW
jgi:hypothetical protein